MNVRAAVGLNLPTLRIIWFLMTQIMSLARARGDLHTLNYIARNLPIANMPVNGHMVDRTYDLSRISFMHEIADPRMLASISSLCASDRYRIHLSGFSIIESRAHCP